MLSRITNQLNQFHIPISPFTKECGFPKRTETKNKGVQILIVFDILYDVQIHTHAHHSLMRR